MKVAVLLLSIFLGVNANAKAILTQAEQIYASLQGFVANNDWANAADALRELNRMAPGWSDGIRNLAAIEVKRGNIKEAMQVFKDGEIHFQNDGDYHLMHCAAFISIMAESPTGVDQLPSHEQMIKTCQKAVKFLPGTPSAVEALGFLLKNISKPKEAIHLYKEFLIKHGSKNATNTETIQKALVEAYIETGTLDDAQKFVHEQVLANPSIATYEMASKMRTIISVKDSLAFEYKKNSTLLAIKTFTASDPRICSDGKWSMAGNYSEEALLYPETLSIETLYSGVNVVRFQNAAISGNHGIISHNCKIYPGSHSYNLDMSEFPGIDDNVEITEVNSTAISIITPHFHTDYFSWFTETIPKVIIARQLMLEDFEFNKAVLIIPTEEIRDHIDDFLYLPSLEVLDGRFQFYPTEPNPPLLHRFHFTKGLYTIDFAPFNSPTTLLDTVTTTPRLLLQKTRDFLHEEVKTLYEFYPRHEINKTQFGTMVLMTSVQFQNQHDVLKHMQNRFGYRVSFSNGKEPFLEQGARYATARVVVGVQGDPLLANYLMCQEGASVIIIPRGVKEREKWLIEEMGGEVVMFEVEGIKDVVSKGGVSAMNGEKTLGEISGGLLDKLEDLMDLMFYRVLEQTANDRPETMPFDHDEL
ncbi:UNVERIFIED_CONTAM: hypothetical protein HDU68_002435 [Siphonaria sp. JEL0065]|nr:hypothetical protein HDU68_002435 [Siphonaria sp. JEL0065]